MWNVYIGSQYFEIVFWRQVAPNITFDRTLSFNIEKPSFNISPRNSSSFCILLSENIICQSLESCNTILTDLNAVMIIKQPCIPSFVIFSSCTVHNALYFSHEMAVKSCISACHSKSSPPSAAFNLVWESGMNIGRKVGQTNMGCCGKNWKASEPLCKKKHISHSTFSTDISEWKKYFNIFL